MEYHLSPDIAEMKARGYDPSTIAEAVARAEQQSKLWAAAQQVAPVIETAFSGVTLGDGVGLQEAQGLDDYADASTCAEYRTGDEKDDWPAFPLRRCNAATAA